MKRSKFSEKPIVYAIRQAEAGTPVCDLCRQLGVSDATFYAWKKKYAHHGVSELGRTDAAYLLAKTPSSQGCPHRSAYLC
jgi:transposase-like protein